MTAPREDVWVIREGDDRGAGQYITGDASWVTNRALARRFVTRAAAQAVVDGRGPCRVVRLVPRRSATYEQGQADERAAIVAWLRDEDLVPTAEDIEADEHRARRSKERR